jgi:hypothetical protein
LPSFRFGIYTTIRRRNEIDPTIDMACNATNVHRALSTNFVRFFNG